MMRPTWFLAVLAFVALSHGARRVARQGCEYNLENINGVARVRRTPCAGAEEAKRAKRSLMYNELLSGVREVYSDNDIPLRVARQIKYGPINGTRGQYTSGEYGPGAPDSNQEEE